MDKILIKDLEAYANIGLTKEERSFPQKLLIDVEASISEWRPSRKEGDLTATVCYQELSNCLASFAKGKPWVLLEEFVQAAIEEVFKSFPKVQKLKMQVRKFVVPNTAWTGVEFKRERRK